MSRHFAYGFLAGLLIGWLWLRFAPTGNDSNARREPMLRMVS